jgi:hypothetical protein
MSLVSHTLVFDDSIEGTANVYTSAEHNSVLGAPDRLFVIVVTSQVSVASGTPTLTLQFEMSADERTWLNAAGTAEINSATINTADRTVLAASGSAGLRFVRFRIALGVATSPRIRVQVWVTGRDNVT